MALVGGTTQPVAKAVALVVFAAALGATDAVIVRLLAGNVHSFVIGFFRAAFGSLVILPWVILRPELLKTNFPLSQHALRAGLKLLALVALFAALGLGRLTDVMAIAFTSPIFVGLGAWAVLGEAMTPRKILALVAGFAGAVIILKPTAGGVSLAAALALFGAATTALIQLMLKSMSAGDRPDTLVVWNLLLTTPIALVLALFFWTTPSPHELGLLALQGALGALCMVAMTRAMSLAEASVVASFDFLRLPFVAFLAWLMFGETVSPTTWIGAAIVCLATMLASRSGGRQPVG
jgi:drug/metabolite transporter (DMT)-like permease